MKTDPFFAGIPFLLEETTDRLVNQTWVFGRCSFKNEGNRPVTSKKTIICYWFLIRAFRYKLELLKTLPVLNNFSDEIIGDIKGWEFW